jgi:3-hydroxyisobutyrate dehydrogenase-like beta-hydroxyacid dehydrogenase
MARKLLWAGNDVAVWNRPQQKARPLEADGAGVAATPVDAARDAEIAAIYHVSATSSGART